MYIYKYNPSGEQHKARVIGAAPPPFAPLENISPNFNAPAKIPPCSPRCSSPLAGEVVVVDAGLWLLEVCVCVSVWWSVRTSVWLLEETVTGKGACGSPVWSRTSCAAAAAVTAASLDEITFLLCACLCVSV